MGDRSQQDEPLAEFEGQVVPLAQRLVREPSPSGEEGAIAGIVAEELGRLGYGRVAVDEYGSVLGAIGAGGPTTLLDAHIDTVPPGDRAGWTRDPHGGEIVDGRLYGRGAADMKGAAAAMIQAGAAGRLGLPGQVVVSCSVCEELIEGKALGAALRRVQPDYVIIGEATGLKVNVGQRGRAEVVVETFGRPAHSSTPEEGVNAVYAMLRLVERVRQLPRGRDPLLGEGILELTDVRSSPYPGASVVPERCRATFDRRLLPGEGAEQVLAPIEAIIADLQRADPSFKATAAIAAAEVPTYTFEVIRGRKLAPAWKLPEDHPLVRAALAGLRAAGLPAATGAYRFCTNGSESAGVLNIPTIGFGPALETDAHVRDESVAVADLRAAFHGFVAILAEVQRLPRVVPRVGPGQGMSAYSAIS